MSREAHAPFCEGLRGETPLVYSPPKTVKKLIIYCGEKRESSILQGGFFYFAFYGSKFARKLVMTAFYDIVFGLSRAIQRLDIR